jgi:phosphoglycolate phosphatase
MEHSLDSTRPYDGIREMLVKLKRQGCRMAVVSNKMMAATQELVNKFFPEIEVALGENEAAGIRKKPAPDMVLKALQQLGEEPETAVYIGDSDVDIQTAKNAGVMCICVLWGFRDKEFLMEHGAQRFIEHPEELIP